MKIKVLSHIYETRCGINHHEANVDVENFDGNVGELAGETSIIVGYHPGGYGLWDVLPTEKLSDGTLNVRWSTSDSCD